MPTSALILTLSQKKSATDALVAKLRKDTRFAIGEPPKDNPSRLPVAMQTTSSEENKACWQHLEQDPGVAFIDVVFIHFDEDISHA